MRCVCVCVYVCVCVCVCMCACVHGYWNIMLAMVCECVCESVYGRLPIYRKGMTKDTIIELLQM